MNTERGNIAVIAIGAILILFVVGFFQHSRTFLDGYNLKALLRLPCGITMEKPGYGSKAQFPMRVSGYANGCGWTHKNGYAGTAQVFDSRGMPLTGAGTLVVPASSADIKPYFFETTLKLLTPPVTDTGQLILTSADGLIHAVPLAF